MKLSLEPETRQLLEIVRSCTPSELPVHLVGGAVRDLALGRPVQDFDFVLPEQSLVLAKQVRRRLHGVGFTLDDERQTARVILNQGQPQELVLDFVIYTGGSLLADVRSRDFTLNTLLIDLDQPEEVLDFLGGWEDLQARRLRAASAQSMQLDPLRVLRGIRFAQGFQLEVEPETQRLMQQAAAGLNRVSGERIRDELFKILAQGQAVGAFRMMDMVGALLPVFPELTALRQLPALPPHVHPLWEHTLQVMAYLDQLLRPQLKAAPSKMNAYLQAAWQALAPYQDKLEAHMNKPLQASRPRASLLKLAALYHDAGKPLVQTQDAHGRFHFYGHDQAGSQLMETRARALMLGKEEIVYLTAVVNAHMRLHAYSKPGIELTNRAIYRYFRGLGEAGLDNALLSLADTLAAFEETLPMDAWQREVNAARQLMAAWFEEDNAVVRPTKLLDGKEVQQLFQISPGPLVGAALDALHEAQAAGEVADREEAIAFVTAFLDAQKQKGYTHENTDE